MGGSPAGWLAMAGNIVDTLVSPPVNDAIDCVSRAVDAIGVDAGAIA